MCSICFFSYSFFNVLRVTLFVLLPFLHLTSAKLLRVFLHPLGFLSFSFRFATHRVIRYFLSPSDFDIHRPLGFLSFSFRFVTHRVIRYFLSPSDFDIVCAIIALVEIKGFEPLTPCLQGRCSPSWAIPPFIGLFRFAGGLKWIRTTDLALIRRAL